MRRATGVALSGVALVLVALAFDSSPLLVPGVALAVIGCTSAAWVRAAAWSCGLTRSLNADRVVEGEPLEAMFEVRRGPLGAPGAQIIDPLARAPVLLDGALSLIRGGRRAQVRVITRFPRRGLHRLAAPRLELSDPLGLACVHAGAGGAGDDLLVLPRTEQVRFVTGRRGIGRQRGAGRQSEPFSAVDVDGLRPYRQGTPASRIHWAALARGGDLLERRLSADGERRPLVVLDPRGSGPPELLDAAVRAAASLVLELARGGGCRLLLGGERRPLEIEPELGSWPGVHARLALVEGGGDLPAPVIGRGLRHGALLYVAAQSLERLPAALATPAAAGQARVLVLPAAIAPAAAAPAFEVAGCRGFLVGQRRGFPGPLPAGPQPWGAAA